MKKEKYTDIFNCRSNDVQLRVLEEDNKVDEIWVRIEGESGFTVVGFEDLCSAVKAKGYDLVVTKL